MASWLIRIASSPGKSSRSRREICCGLHALAQRRCCRRPWRRPFQVTAGPATAAPPGATTAPASRSRTYARSAGFVASLAGFGRCAARSACHWAVVARYSSPPPRVAALRRSSRETVDAARPSRRATSRTPCPCARHSATSSRSANDRYRPEGGLDDRASVDSGMPPASRNQRTPTAGGQDTFLAEAREVPRAGLATAAWVSVDDTGARHEHRNGVCTQLGNDHFAAFATTASKSRLDFLEVLRAGFTDYVIDAEALAYMRRRSLAGAVIDRLAAHPERHFPDEAAWRRHLERLGIIGPTVTPDPVRIATEGAGWGSVKAHGLLPGTVILSDDAGQFALDRHALCWVHAERLVHKLDTFTDRQHAAQQLVRALVWWLYADLKAYKRAPGRRRRHELRARFDRIFRRRTGFATLDRLLARLHANKEELLLVLERPEVPLNTNGSERDLRPQVIKRKISGGTRSEAGRACRDAFLGLLLTCAKLGVSFWDYLGHRLGVAGADAPYLPDLVRLRSAPA